MHALQIMVANLSKKPELRIKIPIFVAYCVKTFLMKSILGMGNALTDILAVLQDDSLLRQFHLPQVFAYGLLAAWGAFPHMAMEYRKTKAAFRARGIRVFPVSPALLAPLLVKSVRWSDELSIAMESKGFSARAERSDCSPARVHPRDWIMLILCCAVLPAASILI